MMHVCPRDLYPCFKTHYIVIIGCMVNLLTRNAVVRDFCNIIRLELMSSIIISYCAVLAVFSATRGAVYRRRTFHVYLRVDTVQYRRLYSSSACVVHQWPSLDSSADSASA